MRFLLTSLGIKNPSLHLDHPEMPENTMADAERWAAGMSVPAYAIDDETAIQVVDGEASVISEGNYRLFTL